MFIVFQIHKLVDSELEQMYRFQGVSIPAEIRVCFHSLQIFRNQKINKYSYLLFEV